VKNLIAAFQFLTILPLPVKIKKENLEHSILWFPLVGAVIGLITGYGWRLLSRLFPTGISSALTIFIYIVLTRGLHLDGYMDTIDGFFSHKQKADGNSIREIMKDPAVGSFAVLGAIIWALLLFSALPHLEPLDHVIIHTYGRLAIILLPLLFAYPGESGTGKFFADHVKAKTLAIAVIITAIIIVLTCLSGSKAKPAVLILSRAALLPFSFLLSLSIGFWSKRKINGISGDILGFTIEANHLLLVLLIPLGSYINFL
jgi:adenosylcobinamide-GDP ribazoletransferase